MKKNNKRVTFNLNDDDKKPRKKVQSLIESFLVSEEMYHNFVTSSKEKEGKK